MYSKEINIKSNEISIKTKISDYLALTKPRLSFLVVFSAVFGYMIATPVIDWNVFFYVCMGGYFVTGASNAFNQVWEKESDKLMDRTKNRPLPRESITIIESLIVASFVGVIGLYFLYNINLQSFILGVFSMFMYVFIYTPLKKVTPLSVFIGAIPGSIPPMIGYIAYTGKFGLEPGILFLVQFIWQFPHFWAIAWKLNEDYSKAGYKMLPFGNVKDKQTAFIIMTYTFITIPIAMLPWALDIAGIVSMILSVILSVYFSYIAYNLYQTLEDKFAKKLMFYSFFYLPLVLILFYIDKTI